MLVLCEVRVLIVCVFSSSFFARTTRYMKHTHTQEIFLNGDLLFATIVQSLLNFINATFFDRFFMVVLQIVHFSYILFDLYSFCNNFFWNSTIMFHFDLCSFFKHFWQTIFLIFVIFLFFSVIINLLTIFLQWIFQRIKIQNYIDVETVYVE